MSTTFSTDRFFAATRPQPQARSDRAFLMEVTSYRLGSTPADDLIVGKRIDDPNNPEVVVRLRAADNSGAAHKRPELRDLMPGQRPVANSAVQKVHPGGLIRVDGAQKEGDVYTSSWLRVISHKPDEAVAMKTPVELRPPRQVDASDPMTGEKHKKTVQSARILLSEAAVVVTTSTGLRERLENLFRQPGSERNSFVLMTLTETNDPAKMSRVHIYAGTPPPGQTDSEDARVARVMAHPSVQTFAEMLDTLSRPEYGEAAKSLKVTLTPGLQLSIGTKSLTMNEVVKSTAAWTYVRSYTREDGSVIATPTSRGYTESFVAITQLKADPEKGLENDYTFISSITPTTFAPKFDLCARPGVGLTDAQITAHIQSMRQQVEQDTSEAQAHEQTTADLPKVDLEDEAPDMRMPGPR